MGFGPETKCLSRMEEGKRKFLGRINGTDLEGQDGERCLTNLQTLQRALCLWLTN